MIRSSVITVAIILMASLRAHGDAPKPEIKSASVLGVPVGSTTSIILYGENLDPKTVSVKAPLTVKIVESKATDEKNKGKGSRQVTLDVTVPDNCPRDTFEVTLTGAENSVIKRTLCVTEKTAVEIQIKKPAGSFATAMPLPGPSTAVLGQLDGDTADLVRFDGIAGEIWDITLLSSRAGSMVDPVLRIRDGRHISLALSAGDKKKDRHIQFVVPTSGPYYLEITEAEARGGAGYNYRLAVIRKQ